MVATFLVTTGEVYNFQELRIKLEALGYQFHSRTDTEVVLYAYAEWGEKVLERLNGMFAFAVWDKQEKELFLARDRFGIKPLYYYEGQRSFLFGSEIKAILAHPLVRAALDKEALLEYFTFQNLFTDRTLFKDIRLLPSGCFMRVRRESEGCCGPRRYWDYDFAEPENSLKDYDYLENLDYLFRQAVNRQLVSDVEVGSFLSGGLDSGTLTAFAAEQIPYIKTFTVGFDLSSASGLEMGMDERTQAEQLSYELKTEHYEMVLKAGDMERCMSTLVWHLEEPRIGQSYPNFYASKLASRFCKVALAGTGGDELFGGYPWRYYRAAVNYDFDHYIAKYYRYWQRLLPNRGAQRNVSPNLAGCQACIHSRYHAQRILSASRRNDPAGGLRQSLDVP